MKKISLLACVLLSAASCTFFRLARSAHLHPPSFAYRDYHLRDIDDRRAAVTFDLAAYNPNAIGLKNVSVSYQLFYEGKRFLQGGDIPVGLVPKDTSAIPVPAESSTGKSSTWTSRCLRTGSRRRKAPSATS